MKRVLTVLLVFGSLVTNGQECSKEILAVKPGKFWQGYQGSVQNVLPADLVKEKAVLNTIFNRIKAVYAPAGLEVKYNFVFGKNLNAGINWKADPFYHSEYLVKYYCDTRDPNHVKYYVDEETPTVLTIAANVAHWFNTLWAADIPSDELRPYFKMAKRPDVINGFLYMGYPLKAGSSGVREDRWLITYHPDSLPFSYISRKEYLSIQKRKLQQDIKDSPSEIKYFQEFLEKIDQYLNVTSSSELQLPACCMWNDEERFDGFVPEGTEGSFIAAKPNPSYYRKNLPRSSPQFFSVVFKYNSNDAVFTKNIDELKKVVDFKALQNMLGK